jgi:hypothetical protein
MLQVTAIHLIGPRTFSLGARLPKFGCGFWAEGRRLLGVALEHPLPQIRLLAAGGVCQSCLFGFAEHIFLASASDCPHLFVLQELHDSIS